MVLVDTPKTFTGKACVRCESTLKYNTKGHCVMCARERAAAWSKANPEEVKLRARVWKKSNPGKIKAERQRNPETYRASRRKWKKANLDKVNAGTQARRLRIRGAMPEWLTEFDLFVIQEYYYKAKRLEELTGQKWHVDHIHPLKGKDVCGLHVPWNLQLLPALHNLKKGNKLEICDGNYV